MVVLSVSLKSTSTPKTDNQPRGGETSRVCGRGSRPEHYAGAVPGFLHLDRPAHHDGNTNRDSAVLCPSCVLWPVLLKHFNDLFM